MSAALKYPPESPKNPAQAGRPAYDPNNLHPLDEEDRKNDPDDGIDYDEIIATTQDDVLAGNVKIFKFEDYPTQEALIKALEAWHEECWKKAAR